MKQVVAAVAGLTLATVALNASAGKAEQQQLAECKSALAAVYGDDLGTRLSNVRHRASGTHMRIRVTPASQPGETVICSKDRDGGLSLTTRDGVALTPAADAAEKVTLAD
jgi:hypothetical protein